MTIYLSMDIFVYLYWVIENLLFVYCMELRAKQYFEYYELIPSTDCSITDSFDMVEPINIADYEHVGSEPEWMGTKHSETAATQIELGENALNLLSEIEQGLQDTIVSEDYLEEDINFYLQIGDEEEETENPIWDDFLSLADYDEIQEDNSNSNKYASLATTKIKDCIDGEQQWVVSVLGHEEGYIHVSDGKRIWLNVGEQVRKLNKDDVLILDVLRQGKEVTVLNLIRVETGVSEDYLIPDEREIEKQDLLAM